MKRIAFCLAVFTVFFTGCSYHQGCTVTLNIVNQTDVEILLVRGIEGTSELSIPSGGEVTADESHGRCGKNHWDASENDQRQET